MRFPFAALLAIAVAACRSAAVPGDAATKEAAAPKPSATTLEPWAQPALDPTQANLVELRDTRTDSRKEHDVVFRLVREGNEFAWTAKGIAVGHLGERAPDPSPAAQKPYGTPCVCDIGVRCTCEQVPEGDEVAAKSGRIASAKVEALLSALLRPLVGPWDPDAGVVTHRAHTAHLVASFPGREFPLHYSLLDGRLHWVADGLPLVPETGADADADPNPALDAAWTRLLEDLDVPKWDLVLNPAPPATLPPDFASLPKATTLDVFDSWNGLGETHAMFVHLVRTGAGFAMRAKVASHDHSIGEPLHDPWDPKGSRHAGGSCECAVTATCECENGVFKKSGNIPAAPVDAFLAEVARHALDPAPADRGGHWTDDYPRGHTAVWVTPGATPIHLSFLDQQRQWRVNGRELSPDPKPTSGSMMEGSHAVINAAYQRMLDAIGLSTWMKTLHGPGGL